MARRKFSKGFKEIFNFFLDSYNAGLITFSGSEDFTVVNNSSAPTALTCFKDFENGVYTTRNEGGYKYNRPIETSEPDVLYAVIKGKKSWGLWIKEWAAGIGEWCFTTEEIVEEFTKNNIEIPDSLMKDFLFVIDKAKSKRYQ